MTNEEILKKAIEKAGKNGWKIPKDWKYQISRSYKMFSSLIVPAVIFSHDFAKAFARYIYETEQHQRFLNLEELPKATPVAEIINMIYPEFLMEIVLKKEPLKYLEKFL